MQHNEKRSAVGGGKDEGGISSQGREGSNTRWDLSFYLNLQILSNNDTI